MDDPLSISLEGLLNLLADSIDLPLALSGAQDEVVGEVARFSDIK
jgi:hypothetical protein